MSINGQLLALVIKSLRDDFYLWASHPIDTGGYHYVEALAQVKQRSYNGSSNKS